MNYDVSFPGIGSLRLIEEDCVLIGIDFLEKGVSTSCQDTLLKIPCVREISEYLEGRRRVFSLPFSFHGTPFQESVWRVVASIPFGTTLTYSHIAEQIGSPRAYRAVGTAVGKNPLPIVIPCHRVISRTGLGGYSGGLHIKKLLLTLEGLL